MKGTDKAVVTNKNNAGSNDDDANEKIRKLPKSVPKSLRREVLKYEIAKQKERNKSKRKSNVSYGGGEEEEKEEDVDDFCGLKTY
eukprot:2087109-Ditylum_brightwellii.AAC.1